MTPVQRKDLSHIAADFRNYLDDNIEKAPKSTYWKITANGSTVIIDGIANFASYGQAKGNLTDHLSKEVLALAKAKPLKRDTKSKAGDNGNVAQDYAMKLAALTGYDFERSIIELRDVMLERGDLTIKEERY